MATEFEITISIVMLRPIPALAALIALPRSPIVLPQSGCANGAFSLSGHSDSDGDSIVVVMLKAIVLMALAYALVIG